MAVGPKLAHDIMMSSGMLSYFAMGDLVNIAKGTVDIAGSGMDSAWNKNEGAGREAGEGIGEVIGSGAMAAANLGLMGHTASIYGKRTTWFGGEDKILGKFTDSKRIVTEAKAILGKGAGEGYGGVYNLLEEGGFQKAGVLKAGKFAPFIGTAKTIPEDSTFGKFLSSRKSTGGNLSMTGPGAGKFIKSQGLIRGLAPFMLAAAAGWGAKSILGFAGGLVDESVRDYKREKSVHYDNRFFNTQKDEMSNMQTLGAAMNNYENRYQSTARIYHSR